MLSLSPRIRRPRSLEASELLYNQVAASPQPFSLSAGHRTQPGALQRQTSKSLVATDGDHRTVTICRIAAKHRRRASPMDGALCGALMGEQISCSGEDSRGILCLSELTYTCYMLEIVGQMMPLPALRDELPKHTLLFVDNEPAKHALQQDDSVNRLLQVLWTFIEENNWWPEWQRVSSSANVSDQVSRFSFSHAYAEGWSWWEHDYDRLLREEGQLPDHVSLRSGMLSVFLGHVWRPDCAIAPTAYGGCARLSPAPPFEVWGG